MLFFLTEFMPFKLEYNLNFDFNIFVKNFDFQPISHPYCALYSSILCRTGAWCESLNECRSRWSYCVKSLILCIK